MRADGLAIVLSGMIAATPAQGGATWAVLQYLLGLQQLGHDVHFIEPVAADKLQPRGTSLSRRRQTREVSGRKRGGDRIGLSQDPDTMPASRSGFTTAFGNEWRTSKLSPSRPHLFVDNLWVIFDVGGPQRREIKHRRGVQQVLLATMKAQQAVAIRFVGRRVTTSTCLFFGCDAHRAAHRIAALAPFDSATTTSQ